MNELYQEFIPRPQRAFARSSHHDGTIHLPVRRAGVSLGKCTQRLGTCGSFAQSMATCAVRKLKSWASVIWCSI